MINEILSDVKRAIIVLALLTIFAILLPLVLFVDKIEDIIYSDR